MYVILTRISRVKFGKLFESDRRRISKLAERRKQRNRKRARKMLANYISLALGVIGFVFNLYLNYVVN